MSMDVECKYATKSTMEAAFRSEYIRHGPLRVDHILYTEKTQKKLAWRVNFHCPLGGSCKCGRQKDRVKTSWTEHSTNKGVAAALLWMIDVPCRCILGQSMKETSLRTFVARACML